MKRYRFARDPNKRSCRSLPDAKALYLSLSLSFLLLSQSIFVVENSRLSLLSVITRKKEEGEERGEEEGIGSNEISRASNTLLLASFHIFNGN